MTVPDDEARAQCVPNSLLVSKNSHRWLRILRVICDWTALSTLNNALAKATPGYVGADLSTLAGAAGIIAVKRICKSFSDGTIIIPDNSASTIIDVDTALHVDVSHSVPIPAISSLPTPSPDARHGELVASSLSITNLPPPISPRSLNAGPTRPSLHHSGRLHVRPQRNSTFCAVRGFATVPDVT
jgi:ribosome biogenesis ATPase